MASYVCALSGEVTSEPVVTSTGFIFDRKAIEQHLSVDPTCPKTSKPLSVLDLILINDDGKAKAGAGKKRMIADADTAVISNSVIPDPLPLFVACVCSAGTGSVLAFALAFKALDVVILNIIPGICLFWGLVSAVDPTWTEEALDLPASASHSAVALVGAVVALASYGVLKAGFSDCSMTKMKLLPLLALVAFNAAKSPLIVDQEKMCSTCILSLPQLAAALPLLLAAAHSQAPALQEYFERNQKAAVKMSVLVREG